MAHILEVEDSKGKIIYLTRERYNHITKHPEMQNSLRTIEETIRKPDKITEFSFDKSVRYYYTYYKNRKSKARYL